MSNATLINGVKTFPVDMVWSDAEIVIIASPTQSCRIDHVKVNAMPLYDDESEAYNDAKKEGKGRSWFQMHMSVPTMRVWKGLKERADQFTPEPAAPAPTANLDIKPALTESKPNAVQEDKPQPAAPLSPPLPSLANYTVTVEQPTGPSNVVQEKKRKRRGEKGGQFINEEYRKRCRGWGLDDMEKQITRMQAVVKKASEDVSLVTYDIPSCIRDLIVDPCGILYCVGFRFHNNKSVWTVPTHTLTSPIMERLFDLWDNFTDPDDPNSGNTWENYYKSMGTDKPPLVEGKLPFIKYGFEEFNAKSMARLRRMAQDALDNTLRSAHTSMLNAIDKADKKLEEALNKADITSKEQEKANCERANEVRGALVEAGEILRRSVAQAVEYDNTENLQNLLSSFRDAVLSQARTFNAMQRLKRAEGVEV